MIELKAKVYRINSGDDVFLLPVVKDKFGSEVSDDDIALNLNYLETQDVRYRAFHRGLVRGSMKSREFQRLLMLQKRDFDRYIQYKREHMHRPPIAGEHLVLSFRGLFDAGRIESIEEKELPQEFHSIVQYWHRE